MGDTTKVAGLEMHCIVHPHPLDTDPETLKPCPFCGAPGAYDDGDRRGHDAYVVAVWCSNTSCAVRTPRHYRSREDAAYAWNRRPGDPPMRAVCEHGNGPTCPACSQLPQTSTNTGDT